MPVQHNKAAGALVACLLPLQAAWATQGTFPHGYGVKSEGMGGVVIALPQDSLAGASNPAGMVAVGDRLDVGAAFLKADNGADGVALARQEKPDAVLMDIVMPGMNGFQATRQLSKDPETRAIPVIVVTTKDQETDRVWATRQGARDFLTKPVEEAALISKLKEVLGA